MKFWCQYIPEGMCLPILFQNSASFAHTTTMGALGWPRHFNGLSVLSMKQGLCVFQWVLWESPELGRTEGGRGSPACVAGSTLSPYSQGPKAAAFQEELFNSSAIGTVTQGYFTVQNDQGIIYSSWFQSDIARYPDLIGCMVCARRFPSQTKLFTVKIFELPLGKKGDYWSHHYSYQDKAKPGIRHSVSWFVSLLLVIQILTLNVSVFFP